MTADSTYPLLPAASVPNQTVTVCKAGADSYTVTILPATGDTIEGAASLVLSSQWDKAVLRSDGVNTWLIVGSSAGSPSHGFGATFNGAGSNLIPGLVAYVTVPNGGTIRAWSILVDAGTCTITVWKVASGAAIPTASNSINTAGVSIASGTAARSTALTDFTTPTIADDDIVGICLQAVSGAKQVVFQVELN